MRRRVLILGGAGAVGMRIARLIGELPDIELLIAGRDYGRTTQFADELSEGGVFARSCGMDDIPGLLARELPVLVIDASASFRGRDLAIPRACIRARIAYLDTAADANFSLEIRSLNTSAIAAGVPVLSGAGITPCVTFAAIDAIAASLASVDGVRIVMCPGNQQPYGPASFGALVARAGKRFRWRRGGKWRSGHAWRKTREERLPEIGHRVVCAIETPDLALLVDRWPGLRDASVFAGMEVMALQRGLRALAWCSRLGLNLARFSGPLETMARTLGHLGTSRFVLRVAVEGRSGRDVVERSWTLLAADGGHLAATPAIAFARRILRGPTLPPGARIAALSLAEVEAELAKSGADIRMTETAL